MHEINRLRRLAGLDDIPVTESKDQTIQSMITEATNSAIRARSVASAAGHSAIATQLSECINKYGHLLDAVNKSNTEQTIKVWNDVMTEQDRSYLKAAVPSSQKQKILESLTSPGHVNEAEEVAGALKKAHAKVSRDMKSSSLAADAKEVHDKSVKAFAAIISMIEGGHQDYAVKAWTELDPACKSYVFASTPAKVHDSIRDYFGETPAPVEEPTNDAESPDVKENFDFDSFVDNYDDTDEFDRYDYASDMEISANDREEEPEFDEEEESIQVSKAQDEALEKLAKKYEFGELFVDSKGVIASQNRTYAVFMSMGGQYGDDIDVAIVDIARPDVDITKSVGPQVTDQIVNDIISNAEGRPSDSYSGVLEKLSVNESYYGMAAYASHDEEEENPTNVVDNKSADGDVWSAEKNRGIKEPTQLDDLGDQSDNEHEGKVKVPSNVKTILKDQIKKYRDDAEKMGITKNDTKMFYIQVAEVMDELLMYLEAGTVRDIKMAQVFWSSLMSPIMYKIPSEVADFIVRGGQRRSLSSFMKSVED